MTRTKTWVMLALLLAFAAGVLAATIKYAYASETTYLATNGYSGGTGDLAADQAYDYGADIDLETNGYYGVWIFLEHDSVGTTDDIIISYFGSPDGTDFDDTPFWTCTAESDGSDDQISWLIYPACPHGRLGVKTSGTTDTFDYRIRYLPWNGNST